MTWSSRIYRRPRTLDPEQVKPRRLASAPILPYERQDGDKIEELFRHLGRLLVSERL